MDCSLKGKFKVNWDLWFAEFTASYQKKSRLGKKGACNRAPQLASEIHFR